MVNYKADGRLRDLRPG